MEFHTSKRKLLRLLALTTILAAAGWFCGMQPEPAARIAGWLGLIFFGLGFVIFPLQLLRKGPVLLIDEEGIEYRRGGGLRVPWSAVKAVWIGRLQSVPYLCIDVEDPARYVLKKDWRVKIWGRISLKSFNGMFGFPELAIAFQELEGEPQDALDYILRAAPFVATESGVAVNVSGLSD